MNSIERLIQTKLRDIIAEERKRIASSLVVEDVAGLGMGRRQKKAMSIKKMQDTLRNLQAKASSSKDPAAMRQKLTLVRQKIQLATTELGMMSTSDDAPKQKPSVPSTSKVNESVDDNDDDDFSSTFFPEKKQIKGWMSPTGNPHLFDAFQNHSENHHPDIKAEVQPKVPFVGAWSPDSPKSINKAINKGYARFGSHGDEHYIHFNKSSKGGKQAAAHALNYLKPQNNSSITITHGKTEKRFTSPSQAALHIKESALMEADPKPRVEKDHLGKPVVPTKDQYVEYFEAMAADHVKEQLKAARERWGEASMSTAEKEALATEIKAAENVLGEATKLKTAPTLKLKKVPKKSSTAQTVAHHLSNGNPLVMAAVHAFTEPNDRAGAAKSLAKSSVGQVVHNPNVTKLLHRWLGWK